MNAVGAVGEMFSCAVPTGIWTNWPLSCLPFCLSWIRTLTATIPVGWVAGTVHVPVHGRPVDAPGAVAPYFSLMFGWFGIVT